MTTQWTDDDTADINAIEAATNEADGLLAKNPPDPAAARTKLAIAKALIAAMKARHN